MEIKLVSELPKDVLVYHCIGLGLSSGYIVERVQDFRGAEFVNRFRWCPKDGLWASSAARQLWDMYPHLHPHYSLFNALYIHLMKN